jgi:hypothetical protein
MIGIIAILYPFLAIAQIDAFEIVKALDAGQTSFVDSQENDPIVSSSRRLGRLSRGQLTSSFLRDR